MSFTKSNCDTYFADTVILAWIAFAKAELGFAVFADKSIRTATLVGARSAVLAHAGILARRVRAAVVQILVAQQATPAGLASTFPGLMAGAVHAARIAFALRAIAAGPAVSAATFARKFAQAVFRVTAVGADWLRAKRSGPAVQTLHFSLSVASVVTERVVARLAQTIALVAIVVRGTDHLIRVQQHGVIRSMKLFDRGRLHLQISLGGQSSDQSFGLQWLLTVAVVVFVPRFDDQREHAGPTEVERHLNRIGESGHLNFRTSQIDAVVAQHRSEQLAESARRVQTDFGLELLDANAKERFARFVTAIALLTVAATGTVGQSSAVVFKRAQVQMEHSHLM